MVRRTPRNGWRGSYDGGPARHLSIVSSPRVLCLSVLRRAFASHPIGAVSALVIGAVAAGTYGNPNRNKACLDKKILGFSVYPIEDPSCCDFEYLKKHPPHSTSKRNKMDV